MERECVSNTPPIDIREQVRGLLMYPYGCLEQTTSSAYPLVFIDVEAARRWGLTPVPREERAKRLETAFARLAGMQQPRGGYGLWAASNPYEGWLTAYVTGFLQDARDAGFAVPEGQMKKSLDNLTEQFQRSPGQQLTPPSAPRRDATIPDCRSCPRMFSMKRSGMPWFDATRSPFWLDADSRRALF